MGVTYEGVHHRQGGGHGSLGQAKFFSFQKVPCPCPLDIKWYTPKLKEKAGKSLEGKMLIVSTKSIRDLPSDIQGRDGFLFSSTSSGQTLLLCFPLEVELILNICVAPQMFGVIFFGWSTFDNFGKKNPF